MNTVEFDPSLLGTKEHWDQRYWQELVNFRESGLEGEVWFGEEPVEKMVGWATMHVPPDSRPNILEVGMGNGHLLFAMVDAGYDAAHLTGIDYSQGSVDLATAIAKQRNDTDETHTHTHPHPRAYRRITFAMCDFLDDESPALAPGRETTSRNTWDLVLDKGTYDAMSLMGHNEQERTPLERYVPRVVRILKPGGHFLITSCNFTEDELVRQIAPQGSSLEYRGSVPYKKFTFGGKSGSSYATVAFQKRAVSLD